MEEELKYYGAHVEHSEAEDREPIDFEIRDDKSDELIATVWGSNPFNDVQIDCNHDIYAIEDEELQGECLICGANCDWHYEANADDGHTIKERVPYEWYTPKEIGGFVGDYIKDLQEKW